MTRLTAAVRRRPLTSGLLLGILVWAALLLTGSCYPPHHAYGPPLNELEQVIDCESSGDPTAIAAGGTVGLLQIDPGWLSGTGGTLWGQVDVILTGTEMSRAEAVEWLSEVGNNLEAGRLIYERTGGWGQWSCQP